jgi:glucan phosphoethanolaminetransferase (alkaline phosphatase superfamily)
MILVAIDTPNTQYFRYCLTTIFFAPLRQCRMIFLLPLDWNTHHNITNSAVSFSLNGTIVASTYAPDSWPSNEYIYESQVIHVVEICGILWAIFFLALWSNSRNHRRQLAHILQSLFSLYTPVISRIFFFYRLFWLVYIYKYCPTVIRVELHNYAS